MLAMDSGVAAQQCPTSGTSDVNDDVIFGQTLPDWRFFPIITWLYYFSLNMF